MKTDRFSDIIRRKLESIRPEFTEKDWVRMQATLHQAGIPQPGHAPTSHPFSGSLWSGGQSWLLAAASVSTAALIGVGIWQHNQIKDLRETVAQLKHKMPTTQVAPAPTVTESPMVTQSNNQPASGSTTEQPLVSTPRAQSDFSAPRRDTVYIDRSITAPATSYPEKRLSGVAQKEAAQSQSINRNYATTDRSSTPSGSLHRQHELTVSPKTDFYGISSTPLTTNKSAFTQSGQGQAASTNQPTYQSAQPDRINEKPTQHEQYVTVTPPVNAGRTEQAQSVNNQPTQATAQSAPTAQSEATSTISASYESIASRPLSPQTVNWNALLAQQAKRSMQPAKVAVVAPSVAKVETKALASKPEKRIEHLGVRFRAGVGGEIASHLLGAGVYTETLLGRHWLVGVGLNQTIYKGRFVSDNDFSAHTHRDFRTEFAPKVDPLRETIHEISNIDVQTNRLQIPLYIGYRIPLTASLAFVPTAGTYLNLNNTETATFYSQVIYNSTAFLPPRVGYDEFTTSSTGPVELINSFAFGTGLEWQQKHWVVQASPVLTVPLQANVRPMQPEPTWQQNVTLGLRARLLYQF